MKQTNMRGHENNKNKEWKTCTSQLGSQAVWGGWTRIGGWEGGKEGRGVECFARVCSPCLAPLYLAAQSALRTRAAPRGPQTLARERRLQNFSDSARIAMTFASPRTRSTRQQRVGHQLPQPRGSVSDKSSAAGMRPPSDGRAISCGKTRKTEVYEKDSSG